MESYQHIQQRHHKEVQDIWEGEITIEEKIDGSQFRIEFYPDREMDFGSHHNDGVGVDSMFRVAIESAKKIFQDYKPEVRTTIFCEYLSKPKQNSIPYENVPNNNLILFDVKRDDKYLNRKKKEEFAKKHGLDIVPPVRFSFMLTVSSSLIYRIQTGLVL